MDKQLVMRLCVLLICSVAVFGANGDITAVRIIGSATAVTDAASACNSAAACSGWVAEIDASGLSTGGTYSLGIGINNDPATAKVVCAVTSSGYDTAGVLGTTQRVVYGTHQLRRVYNAGYTPPYPSDETLVGGTLTLRVSLSDAIYSGDTLTCNVSEAIYTQGGTPTNAVAGTAVTNNSTLTYSQARAIANWSWPGWSLITGNTLTVRAVGYQRHAQNKRPLAAMIFTATDQHSHSASATVYDMAIDAAMADVAKVQEYVGNLDVSAFTQADLVTVNFAALPWVGDSTAAMDTSDAVNTMPTPLYAPQYYIVDRLGTYGTAAAVVEGSSGNDSDCSTHSVSEAAFNASPTSNDANSHPCATIRGGAVAIRAWNAANASPSRADVAGTIWVKAGSYTWTGSSASISASSGTNKDSAWTTITTFPGVDRSSVVVTGSSGSPNYRLTSTALVKVVGITISVETGAPGVVFDTGKYGWFAECNLLMTSGTAMASGTVGGVVYYTHNSVGTNATCAGGASATCLKSGFTSISNSSYPALIRGNRLDGISNTINAFTVLGNVNSPIVSVPGFQVQSSDITTVPSKQPIFSYNIFTNLKITGAAMQLFASQASPLGAAIVNNVLEMNSSNGASTFYFGGGTVTPVNNVMLWHNTVVGQRTIRAYNDTGTTAVIHTLWSERGNIYESESLKSDTFLTANAARVGNWAVEYGVGFSGNVNAEAKNGAASVGQPGFQPEFSGLWSKFPRVGVGQSRDAQAATQPPSYPADQQALSWIGFASRAGWDGVSTGTGNGDYHTSVSSPAVKSVSSGSAVLPFDLEGNPRLNSGNGSAGAYESGKDPSGIPAPVVW